MGIAYVGYTLPIDKIRSILLSKGKNKENKIAMLLLRNKNIDYDLLNEISNRIKRSINKNGIFQLQKFEYYLSCSKNIKDYCNNDIEVLKDDDKYSGIKYESEMELNYRKEYNEWINSQERTYFLNNIHKFDTLYDSYDKHKNLLGKFKFWLRVQKEIPKKLPHLDDFKVNIKEVRFIDSPKAGEAYERLEKSKEKEERLKEKIKWLNSIERKKWLEDQNLNLKLLEKYKNQIYENKHLANSVFDHFIYEGHQNEFTEFLKFIDRYKDSIMEEFRKLEEQRYKTKYRSIEDEMFKKKIKDLFREKYKIDCFDDDTYNKPIIYNFSSINKRNIIFECSKLFNNDIVLILKNMIYKNENAIILTVG